MWVKFDDSMPEDPAVDRLSHGAFRLYVSAICYAQKHLTDGHVDAERVPRLMRRYRTGFADELVAAGLWQPDANGYAVRNFAKWNKTRDYWKAEQAAATARKAAWRRETGRN